MMATVKKFSFVALDLDGTTLNDEHELTERTANVLRQLSAQGVVVSIATGRSTKNLLKYVQQLDLQQPVVPIVGFNGSCGFSVTKADKSYAVEPLFCEPLPAHLVKRLLDFAASHGCVAQYYNGENGDVYAVPLNDEHLALLKRYELLVGSPQVIVSSYQEAVERSLPAKLLIMTNDADRIIAAAREELPVDELTIIKGSPHPFFVEFLPAHVNKGAGLSKLCSMLSVSMESVVAFGDGDNDKEMLQLAGRGCAVSNAKHLAAQSADLVLQWSNQEEAVAQELERMIRDNEFQQAL